MQLEHVIGFGLLPIVGLPYSVGHAMKHHTYRTETGKSMMTEEGQEELSFAMLWNVANFIIATEYFGYEGSLVLARTMTVTPTIVRAAAITAPVAVGAAAVSIAYEQTVNKQIRQGRSGTWFGPFGSGFGSVV